MERGSVEHRTKVAEKYGINLQEVIDLPKDMFEIFLAGLEIGEKYAGKKIIEYLKGEATK